MQKRFLLSTQTFVQLSVILAIIYVALLGSACSVAHVEKSQWSASSLPVADSASMPEVIRQLVSKADSQFYSDQLQSAQATLERALRINPRQPEIWSRMANIYQIQGQAAKATEYARRSNHYIRDNELLRQFNDNIISSLPTGQ